MTRTLILTGTPRGKQRHRTGRGGHTYTPKLTTQYEAALRALWTGSPIPRHIPVQVSVLAIHVLPASWSKRKRAELAGRRRVGKPDVDNVGKIVLDALSKVAWRDDAQVAKLTVAQWWGYETDREGRVSVEVTWTAEEVTT